jgi:hypothetical protein
MWNCHQITNRPGLKQDVFLRLLISLNSKSLPDETGGEDWDPRNPNFGEVILNLTMIPIWQRSETWQWKDFKVIMNHARHAVCAILCHKPFRQRNPQFYRSDALFSLWSPRAQINCPSSVCHAHSSGGLIAFKWGKFWLWYCSFLRL